MASFQLTELVRRWRSVCQGQQLWYDMTLPRTTVVKKPFQGQAPSIDHSKTVRPFTTDG
jgi:hypothetical protein